MKSKSVLVVLSAFVVMGNQCSNQQPAKESATQSETVPDANQTTLKLEMEAIAGRITKQVSREETYRDIEAVANKFQSEPLLVFVADKYRELETVPARRIVSQLAEIGFKKFGTAQWQFYNAFYVGTGVDTPPDPEKALAILDMPASGTMRNALTLRAKMLMKLGDTSDSAKASVKELLVKAAALGDGEATEILNKIGT